MHHAVITRQDFEEKMKRGGGAGVTRERGYLARLDKECNETCPEAIDLYNRLCSKQ